jgi:hypothetical protein
MGPSPQVASYGGFHHKLPFPVPFTIACYLWNPYPSVPTPYLLSESILFPTAFTASLGSISFYNRLESLSIGSHTLSFKREYTISYNLDYLSHRYAIRLLFLPRDHIIQFPPHKPDNPKLTLPTSTRLYNNIVQYTILPLENQLYDQYRESISQK